MLVTAKGKAVVADELDTCDSFDDFEPFAVDSADSSARPQLPHGDIAWMIR